MSNIIDAVIKSWKEQDSIIATNQSGAESARDSKIDTLAAVSTVETWSTDSLGAAGSSRTIVKDLLAKYHGVPADKVNKSELSKYCTYAHPKVRSRLPALRKAATTERDTNVGWNKSLKREDVVLKFCKHMKADDVKSVEAAKVLVQAEYAEAKKKKADAPAAGTPAAWEARAESVTKAAAALYTKASVDALKAAVTGMELKPVDGPEVDGATAELSDMLASLGAGADTTKQQAIALLSALLAK